MFRKLSLAIMAIAMCSVSMAYSHTVDGDQLHPVEFVDEGLRDAVIDAINDEYALWNSEWAQAIAEGQLGFRSPIGYDTVLTYQHTNEVKKLEYTDKGLSDLTGLEHCYYLEDLNLKNNNIQDLSIFSYAYPSFVFLTKLRLGHNEITDIKPVADLTGLRVLYAGNNQISDISDLETLTKLKKLGLARNIGITDISAVSKLTNLELLNMNYCRVKDIEPLRGLTKLEIVSFLWNKDIQDASAIYETENGGLRNNSWDRIDLRFNDLNEASLEALAEMRDEITANGGFVGFSTEGAAAPPIPKGKITTTWASLKRR